MARLDLQTTLLARSSVQTVPLLCALNVVTRGMVTLLAAKRILKTSVKTGREERSLSVRCVAPKSKRVKVAIT